MNNSNDQNERLSPIMKDEGGSTIQWVYETCMTYWMSQKTINNVNPIKNILMIMPYRNQIRLEWSPIAK